MHHVPNLLQLLFLHEKDWLHGRCVTIEAIQVASKVASQVTLQNTSLSDGHPVAAVFDLHSLHHARSIHSSDKVTCYLPCLQNKFAIALLAVAQVSSHMTGQMILDVCPFFDLSQQLQSFLLCHHQVGCIQIFRWLLQ